MQGVVVRYKTKADQGDDNQALVEAVFADLAATHPEGLRYATFRLDDGVTFVHIAFVETEDGSNPLGGSAAFAAFQEGIVDRCDEPPAPSPATVVGSYGFFD